MTWTPGDQQTDSRGTRHLLPSVTRVTIYKRDQGTIMYRAWSIFSAWKSCSTPELEPHVTQLPSYIFIFISGAPSSPMTTSCVNLGTRNPIFEGKKVRGGHDTIKSLATFGPGISGRPLYGWRQEEDAYTESPSCSSKPDPVDFIYIYIGQEHEGWCHFMHTWAKSKTVCTA